MLCLFASFSLCFDIRVVSSLVIGIQKQVSKAFVGMYMYMNVTRYIDPTGYYNIYNNSQICDAKNW